MIELLCIGLNGYGPTPAETAALVGRLDRDSPAQLAVLAAGLDVPDLVKTELSGVMLHGLDYTPYAP